MKKVKGKVLLDMIAVLTQKEEDTKTTASGIIIPANAKSEEPKTGEVVLVGPGRTEEPMEVKIGDKVCFSKHAGTKITNEEGLFLTILRQSEITFVL